VHDRFVEACVVKARRLRVGNGSDPETEIGPMITSANCKPSKPTSPTLWRRAHGCSAAALASPNSGPNFYAPTVLTEVTHAMRILTEETFGPVLPIMLFDIEGEAIHLANSSDYGLAASVWTSNPPAAKPQPAAFAPARSW